MAPLGPSTRQSRRPTPQVTHEGGLENLPPSDSHCPQVEPSAQMWWMALSFPRAKQSMRAPPQLTHEGCEEKSPPRDSRRLSQPRPPLSSRGTRVRLLSCPAAKQ